MFRRRTLPGLLLNARGRSAVGTAALISGWVLVGVGVVLALPPRLNVMLTIPPCPHGRHRRSPASAIAAPVTPVGAVR